MSSVVSCWLDFTYIPCGKGALNQSLPKGRRLGRPKVRRDRDKDAKIIRQMRADGDSYGEIAEALDRTKSDIYRVCMTLGCSEPANPPVSLTL